MCTEKQITEAITSEGDLIARLKPLSETEIFDFMQNLRGGTYFNMGMYSFIPVSRAYKKTLRIYKVLNMTAIVSGVSYENIGTTKDFRDRTGKGPGGAWYDHMSGFENKVGVKKSDPNSKYVLWDIKAGSDSWVRYYVVDIATGMVQPISKTDIMSSSYLTDSEKAKLTPKKVEGYDKTTGELIENQTNWRTASFEHIFWLSQAGKSTKEYGAKFMESVVVEKNNLTEGVGTELFIDAHAGVKTDLDAILSGAMDEDYQKSLTESTEELESKLVDLFWDGIKGYTSDVWFDSSTDEKEEILWQALEQIGEPVDEEYAKEIFWMWADGLEEDSFVSFDSFDEACRPDSQLKEAYRRIVSRGKSLVENELFVDFE